ncbi:unnamed protein product [Cylindrotheca closterium]|uniref:NADP-dependent oxidoreductase domain-containing protein n=1 Tax=Cylindrotheca closterium TaxID=2856 RepID=A0AAD2FQ69_9STRA|nr:unnamed protein product [Cylindrotheca closterium]
MSLSHLFCIFFLYTTLAPTVTCLDGGATTTGKAPSKRTLSPYDNDGHPTDLGSSFPRLTYGTAWKKDATTSLVYQAIHAGFRHVDTACQPKHYHEAGVGEGWTKAAHELGLDRSHVWLQTKYTSVSGQDPSRIPYNPEVSLRDQVHQSLQASLKNLQTNYLDSWVMHGPESSWEDNFEVWTAMEEMVDAGLVKQIGISNFYDPGAVKYLYENARIKPAVVQNRFYGDTGYDVQIRQFCLDHGMEYQSFWTLGANRHFLGDSRVVRLAQKRNLTPEAILYATALKLGITPLDGTTSVQHMQEDMALLRRLREGGEEIISDREIRILTRILGIPSEGEADSMDEDEEEEEEEL